MTSITHIGLGPMGSAITICLRSNNSELALWIRTSAKKEPFVNWGAGAADSIDAAVAASDTVIFFIRDYASTF